MTKVVGQGGEVCGVPEFVWGMTVDKWSRSGVTCDDAIGTNYFGKN